MTPAGDLPCFVSTVAGGAVKGSWWGHPKGALIYDLANALHVSTEVATLRLVEGRNTFVHRSLWPAIYRVVTDPQERRSRSQGLSSLEERLLADVEKAGTLRLDAWAERGRRDAKAVKKAKDRLTASLLVNASSVHTETGNHATVLADWSRWATADVKRAAKRVSLEDARSTLQAACRGRATSL